MQSYRTCIPEPLLCSPAPAAPTSLTRGRNQHPGRIRTVLPLYVLLSLARRMRPMPTRVSLLQRVARSWRKPRGIVNPP